MNVLLVYGTSEGQTRKIAHWVAQRLTRNGHTVCMVDARESAHRPDPRDVHVVLIAASLHAGRYQRSVIDFVTRNRAVIEAKPNAFLAISLTAAGSDARDAAGLEQCVAKFVQQTGWTPQRIHHVAGALRYTAYGLFTRWMMKRIAARRGGPSDTRRDYELTDWDDLGAFVDVFAASQGTAAQEHATA